MKNHEQGHKRRVRYQGAYPRNYQEKYKEHQPDRYPETVERVIQKGSTPAGMHIPICVNEIMAFLQIKPGQTGLDATLGYGGHTRRMLECLAGAGHLYALDVDPVEIARTTKRLRSLGFHEDILTIRQMNFSAADLVAAEAGGFDFVLADLGVSSMQIDNPGRGFSYKTDGPLDLRLNPAQGIPAAKRLQEIDQDELQGMLRENSDEPYAAEIARAVIAARRKGIDIATTAALREVVEEALSFIPAEKRKETVKKTCQRTFQALRIDVNQEFEVLYEFLEKLPQILKPGGRAAILTFHSGEDRIVKKIFRQMYQEGRYLDISRNVTRPSAEECSRNSRARSAKMRWAVKASC